MWLFGNVSEFFRQFPHSPQTCYGRRLGPVLGSAIILIALGMFFPALALSQSDNTSWHPSDFEDEPPSWCDEGRWKHGGYRIRAKSHLLVDETVRITTEGWAFLDRGIRSYFYDSLGGLRGDQRAGWDGRARLAYTLTASNGIESRSGWVWAVSRLSNQIPHCVKLPVIFQDERPTVELELLSTYYPGQSIVEIELESVLDPYSRRGMNDEPPQLEVWVKPDAKMNDQGQCELLENPKWERRLSMVTPGRYPLHISQCTAFPKIQARAYDGTYYSPWVVKSAFQY